MNIGSESSLNKVAFVTGASSGLGYEISLELARKGFDVVIVARREARLKTLSDEIKRLGKNALIEVRDVTVHGEIEEAVKNTIKSWGRIDVVVANAGFGVAGGIERLTLLDYQRQFETNVFGVLRTVIATLAYLKETKGRLALIGSVNGYISLPLGSAYAMSKFAVRALAESLYLELKESGVSVTHIAPGFVKTEIRQVDNKGQWHESSKADAPSWLAADASSAAKEIVWAIMKRKRERVITRHGKIILLIQKHAPCLVYKIIQIFGVKKRKEVRA